MPLSPLVVLPDVVSVPPSPCPPVVGVVGVVVDDDVLVVFPSPCPPVVLVEGSVSVFDWVAGVVVEVLDWVEVVVDCVDVDVVVGVFFGCVFFGVVCTWVWQSLFVSDWIVLAPWLRFAISVELTPFRLEIWLWKSARARCALRQLLAASDCSRVFSWSVSRAACDCESHWPPLLPQPAIAAMAKPTPAATNALFTKPIRGRL
jgi:hypothetical protein